MFVTPISADLLQNAPGRPVFQSPDLHTALLHHRWQEAARHIRQQIEAGDHTLWVLRWTCLSQSSNALTAVETEAKHQGLDLNLETDPMVQLEGQHVLKTIDTLVFWAKWPSFKGLYSLSLRRLHYLLRNIHLYPLNGNHDLVIGLELSNVLLKLKDARLALHVLQELANKVAVLPDHEEKSLYYSLLGRMSLSLGNVSLAVFWFGQVEVLLTGTTWPYTSDPRMSLDIPSNYLGHSLLIMNRSFLLLGDGHYAAATEILQKIQDSSPVIQANVAVLSLYNGSVEGPTQCLKNALTQFPFLINQPAIPFNLSTLFEMSDHTDEKKEDLYKKAILIAGDSFDVMSLKPSDK
jgi:hypothetical protein